MACNSDGINILNTRFWLYFPQVISYFYMLLASSKASPRVFILPCLPTPLPPTNQLPFTAESDRHLALPLKKYREQINNRVPQKYNRRSIALSFKKCRQIALPFEIYLPVGSPPNRHDHIKPSTAHEVEMAEWLNVHVMHGCMQGVGVQTQVFGSSLIVLLGSLKKMQ